LNTLLENSLSAPAFSLAVHVGSRFHRLGIPPGISVRDALDATDLRVRAACGGTGTCGACVVRLLDGAANPFTLAEYQKLSPSEREQGLRLACQLRAQGDITIRIDDPAPPSPWKSIPPENLLPVSGGMPELAQHIYGVAVDLGTTHIRVALWDRKRGRRIATRRGANPQGDFGADVLNRLDAALVSPQRARELAALARAAIVQAVRDMLARDVGEVSPMLAEIGQVLIVGNTAMLALLSGRGSAELMNPDNWQTEIDCRPSDESAWREPWHMPHARIALPAPVAGFIGSDLLASLLATRLTEGAPGSMLLDVGTNTEIALWDGERLLLTSVPGGPAFEGVGIRHGMPAENGAIYRIQSAASGFDCAVIGGGEARGLCGSGLVDGVAVLLQNGVLKPSGRFAALPGKEGVVLLPGNPRSALTSGDVDAFQRAKAATAAAMAELLHQAGMDWRGLRRLCVCGAFGRQLDIHHAQAVGLLPALEASQIELVADAALAGCEVALLRPDSEAAFAQLTNLACPINLSFVEGYDDRYIDHLRLKPLLSH
jgi:uncharacterized 2Fe-2S/4Fe-4S cluster protein (DUF4445 family)